MKFFNKKKTAMYIFLLPGFLAFCFSVVVPFFMGVNIAFTDWNGISPDYNWVGIKNFTNFIKDPRAVQPILNSLKFAVLGTIGSNVASLGLAMIANHNCGKFGNVVKLLFFIPVCFSSILTAFVWGFIYKEVFSQLFHIKSLLGNTTWVIPAITLMGIWNSCGINMLIYLSGLKSVPADLYEAATMDGASAWDKFKNITLPFLNSAFTVCCTLSLTSWLREFAMTLSATGGGPGGSSRIISIYIYENLYSYNKAGYGQAVALIFAVFLIFIGNVVSGFFRKREVEQ